MSNVPAVVTSSLDSLRQFLLKTPKLNNICQLIEKETKINAEYFAAGILVLGVISLFTGFGANFICQGVGFIYPLYATILCIEKQKDEEKTQWLTYWVIFSIIGVLESFIEVLLYWVPFFYPLKLSFTLWLMLPQYKGAQIIFRDLVLPVLQKNEDAIDAAIRKVSQSDVYKSVSAAAAATASTLKTE